MMTTIPCTGRDEEVEGYVVKLMERGRGGGGRGEGGGRRALKRDSKRCLTRIDVLLSEPAGLLLT